MSKTYEAVIIGGGIVGSSVGYHLAREGVETLLIDRDDHGRATDAGAGVISPATSSRTADDTWFEFATGAVEYYPELDEQLERDGATETSYAQQGTIAAAIDPDEIEPFEEALQRIDDRNLDTIEEIDPSEAVERFPALAEPKRVFYYPEAGRVDGRAFAEALQTAGRSHGLETLADEVTSIRTESGAISGVEAASSGRINAESVVVAGGAWSPTLGDQLGVTLPIDPQRGQVAHLSLPDTNTDSWPIVNSFRHHYIVPWPDGKIIFGATREPDIAFDPRLTAGGVDEVLSEGLRVAPGLQDATLEELRVGLRPVSEDNIPILGPIADVNGAYAATGHGATGLMLGPYSGKIVAECVTGEREHIPESFSVARFE